MLWNKNKNVCLRHTRATGPSVKQANLCTGSTGGKIFYQIEQKTPRETKTLDLARSRDLFLFLFRGLILFRKTETEKTKTQMIFEIFIDLTARFLWNLPQNEKKGMRLMYHIEQMFFYFKDHFPSYKVSYQLEMKQEEVNLTDFLQEFSLWLNEVSGFPLSHFYQMWENYIEVYKKEIPVAGALIFRPGTLDSFEVLCVLGTESQKWGFPKGKCNQYESLYDCAKREVMEETGWTALYLITHSKERNLHERLPQRRNFSKPARPKSLAIKRKELTVYYLDLHKGAIPNGKPITPTRIYLLYYPTLKQLFSPSADQWLKPDGREVSEVAWLQWNSLKTMPTVIFQLRKHFHLLSKAMKEVCKCSLSTHQYRRDFFFPFFASQIKL